MRTTLETEYERGPVLSQPGSERGGSTSYQISSLACDYVARSLALISLGHASHFYQDSPIKLLNRGQLVAPRYFGQDIVEDLLGPAFAAFSLARGSVAWFNHPVMSTDGMRHLRFPLSCLCFQHWTTLPADCACLRSAMLRTCPRAISTLTCQRMACSPLFTLYVNTRKSS
jgi:hypothetical protein